MQHNGRESRNLVEGADAIRCLSRGERGDLALAGFYLARRSNEVVESDPEKAARLLRAAELSYVKEIAKALKEEDERVVAWSWHILGDFYFRINYKKKAAFAYMRERAAMRRADQANGITQVQT